jgi:hypothetical protein
VPAVTIPVDWLFGSEEHERRLVCTAAFDVEERVASAIALLPVRHRGDGDVDDESYTCSQSTYQDDSDPSRSRVEERESFVANAATGLNGAETVGIFDLYLHEHAITDHHAKIDGRENHTKSCNQSIVV